MIRGGVVLPLALSCSWSVTLLVADAIVAGESLCSSFATRPASELWLLPPLTPPWSGGEESPLCAEPLLLSSSACCVLAEGRGFVTGGCAGTLLSSGAALQPSGSARRADLERTGPAAATCGSVSEAGATPSRPTELRLSETSTESDDDLVPRKEDRLLASSAAAEDEDVWSPVLVLVMERNTSPSESKRGSAADAEEAADTTFSASQSSFRISHKAFELTKESALRSRSQFGGAGDAAFLSTTPNNTWESKR